MSSTAGSAQRRTPKSPAPAAKPGETRKRGPYVSEAMLERRRRMIDVAKTMIAESGADGFTIRELTERAGVSITVVYSAYGDKEGLIAAAIQDFYERLPVAARPAPKALGRLLADIDESAAVILANAAYSRSLADLYFSRTVDARIYAIIHNMPIITFQPWLEKVMAAGATVPGLSLASMCSTLANDRWSVIFDWARGRIPNGDLASAMATSFLITAAGLTAGPVRARLDAALRKTLRA